MKAAEHYEEKIFIFEGQDPKIPQDRKNRFAENVKDMREKSSITPDTHKARGFVENENMLLHCAAALNQQGELSHIPNILGQQAQQQPIISNKSELDCPYYIDGYQFQNSYKSRVLHFGINSVYAKSKIAANLLIADTDPALSQTSYAPEVIKAVKHHEIEVKLIQKAIEHLYTQKQDTVLVDIFARHITKKDPAKNGLIRLDKNGDIETHTIVLYKQGNDVLIIDPSNYNFSSHLINGDIQYQTKVILPQKAYKIYTPLDKDKIGPNHNQWRDCEDIAAKIAFWLNEFGLTNQDIPQDRIIKSLTNNDKVDESIIEIQLPTRIKQTSDIHNVDKFYNITRIMDKNIKIVKSAHNNISNDIKIKYVATILNTHDLTLVNDALLNINKDFAVQLSGALNLEQINLENI